MFDQSLSVKGGVVVNVPCLSIGRAGAMGSPNMFRRRSIYANILQGVGRSIAEGISLRYLVIIAGLGASTMRQVDRWERVVWQHTTHSDSK